MVKSLIISFFKQQREAVLHRAVLARWESVGKAPATLRTQISRTYIKSGVWLLLMVLSIQEMNLGILRARWLVRLAKMLDFVFSGGPHLMVEGRE